MVRRPLQPRDTNVAASPAAVVVGKPRAVTRLLAAPPPPPQLPQAAVAKAERGVAVVPAAAEVSLAEELERARGRRGRLREARERAEVEMDGRAEALDREAAEWARRAGEQRRLVAELMRLIGTPEVSKAKVGPPPSSSPSLHPSVRPMYLFFFGKSRFSMVQKCINSGCRCTLLWSR
jgi:hypothetical protein